MSVTDDTPVKQCICPDCGTIAEVRRQRVGKRLRYLFCDNGHGGLMTRSRADEWEKIEVDYIGEFGTKPEENKPVVTQLKTDDSMELLAGGVEKLMDWKPSDSDLPEVVEPEIKPDVEKNADDPNDNMPSFIKYGLVILGVLGGCGVAYAASKKRLSV